MNYTQHSPHWGALIKDLKQAGISQTEIAAHCAVSKSTLSELANGVAKRDPGYLVGVRLVELHKKHRRKFDSYQPLCKPFNHKDKL